MGDEAAGISIRDLTVDVAGLRLLEDASAEFPSGKVTLIIGASGAGKTVLMKILAGLEDRQAIRATGSIRVSGKEVVGRRDGRIDMGLVFQNFALFDEFSCRENVEFALEHAPPRSRGGPDASPGKAAARARALLEEFEIPAHTPVRSLSGGQQQRLAVARTLAYDPPVIIYDEPTSGLDPANASRVARRIHETGKAHGKTTLVVTHDIEHLASMADKIYVLDPREMKLRELAQDALGDLASHLPGARIIQEGARVKSRAHPVRLLLSTSKALENTGMAMVRAFTTLFHLVPLWKSLRWGGRFFLRYLGLVASPSAWLYFACAGLIAGFVSTYFTFKFLPHRLYTEPLIADEMLQALGYVLFRTVVPVLATVLMAARCGAAIASDIGNRSYTHQLDAMRSFGVRPSSYLLTNILYAFLAATPLLVAISFLAARYTSLLVFVFNHPERGAIFWDLNFHQDLRVAGEWYYQGTAWLLAKVLVCGLGVGAISYFIASRPKASGVQVSRGITSTIIWTTLFVLAPHFAFAFFEFEIQS